MEALLESRGLLEAVLRDTSDGQTYLQSSDEYKLKMAKARSLIVQGLGDKPLRTMLSEKKYPAAMYKKLNERNPTRSPTSRVQLRTELHYMSYKSGKLMSEYIDEMESIFN